MCFIKRYRSQFLLLLVVLPVGMAAQDVLFIGGGVSYQIPTNHFGSQSFGFATVAKGGYGINAGTLWFYNPRLSLSTELGYSYFPKDENIWNQDSHGDIKVNYQMMNAIAQGNFYFSEDEFMPYLGALFGIYYLRNMVNFDSNYLGTDNDASVSYVSKTWHVGFGIETGTYIELSKTSALQLSLRYTFIPNIEPEYYPEDDVTINPHGKQNHWGVSVKLFFSRK